MTKYGPIREILIHNRFRDYGIVRMQELEEQVFILTGVREKNRVRIDNYLEVPNRHRDPKNFFRLDLHDVSPRHARTMVGVMHTHPEGQPKGPSNRDIEQMSLLPVMVGIVVHTPTRSVTFFDLDGVIKSTVWR